MFRQLVAAHGSNVSREGVHICRIGDCTRHPCLVHIPNLFSSRSLVNKNVEVRVRDPDSSEFYVTQVSIILFNVHNVGCA